MPEQLRFGVELEMVLKPKDSILEQLVKNGGYVLITPSPDGTPDEADDGLRENNHSAIRWFIREHFRQNTRISNPANNIMIII